MVPAVRPPKPRDRVDELRLAVAVDPGDTDDLALPDLERDAVHLLDTSLVADVEIGDLEERNTRRGIRLLDLEQDLATDHEPREALLRRARGRQRLDHLAAPDHGHTIGDVEHLAQLVADEDDRHPLANEALEDREELLRLLRREYGGGLVEDEDVRPAIQRLQDLDPLLLPDRDVLRCVHRGRWRTRMTPARSRTRALAAP